MFFFQDFYIGSSAIIGLQLSNDIYYDAYFFSHSNYVNILVQQSVIRHLLFCFTSDCPGLCGFKNPSSCGNVGNGNETLHDVTNDRKDIVAFIQVYCSSN
jgi:hypothetical protein